MTSGAKLGLLGSLYLSQGLPFGFFTQALPVLMRQQGRSLEAIGLTSLLALPWALKFLWAPLVDRHGSDACGRRRSWILPLQGLAAATLLLLSWADPAAGLAVVMAGVLATNLMAATQDIATDALAVDLLEPRERGLANGIQVAGYRVGMIIGGGAMLMVFDRMGWSATFQAMALLLACATVPVLVFRERPQGAGGACGRAEVGLGAILRFVQRPGMAAWLVVLIAYKWGDALASAMVRPLLVDLELTPGDVGWLIGTVGSTAGLVGALAGGAGAQLLGRRRALFAFGALQMLAVTGYLLPALGHTSPWILHVTCALEHLTGGMATVALFTMMMDACDPRTAATDYTLQASLVVIATGSASTLSGFSASALGYGGHFALSAVLCGLGLAFTGVLLHGRSGPGADSTMAADPEEEESEELGEEETT